MGQKGRVVDLRLTIDGLLLDDDMSVEDFIKGLEINSIYPIVWEVLYEECCELNE